MGGMAVGACEKAPNADNNPKRKVCTRFVFIAVRKNSVIYGLYGYFSPNSVNNNIISVKP